ncbi:sensor histidine kinase, partial [Acidithiobacillus sp. GGI-221]
GSGLGLAIARQLAEAQGMRLRLFNAVGGGLCAELSWTA